MRLLTHTMHKIRPSLVPSHIFKPNDIRGAYPAELNEKGVYAVARSFVHYLLLRKPDHQKIQVVVSHDGNDSSIALYNSFIGGLLDEGADVLDIGIVTPSIHSFAVEHTHADGGAIFLAVEGDISSIVLSSVGAAPIGEGLGMEEIRNVALRGIFTSIGGSATLQSGVRMQKEFLHEYTQYFVKEFQGLQSVSMKINITGTEPVVKIVEGIMKYFPKIEAEYSGGISMSGGMSVSFGDDEKVTFFDEMGKKISVDSTAGFFVGEYAASGDRVVYDLRLSKAVAEAANAHGIAASSCRVGNVFLRDLMRRDDVMFGADMKGRFYFKDFFYTASGIFALLTVLYILGKNTRPFSQLIAPYRHYGKSSEMNFKVKGREQCIDSFAAVFHDALLSYEDGLSIKYEDWWCNIRPSSTEDLFRVNVEADTPELLDKKIKLLSELMEQYS